MLRTPPLLATFFAAFFFVHAAIAQENAGFRDALGRMSVGIGQIQPLTDQMVLAFHATRLDFGGRSHVGTIEPSATGAVLLDAETALPVAGAIRLSGEFPVGNKVALLLRFEAEFGSAEPTEVAPAPVQKKDQSSKAANRLRQLKGLLDEGLITDEDYERKKQEILDEI